MQDEGVVVRRLRSHKLDVRIVLERILLGQGHGEDAAVLQGALHADGAVMQFHQPFGQRQPDAAAW